MEVTHIPCGQDGWAHLTAVIDCHDREVIGYESRCGVGRSRRSGRSKREILAGPSSGGLATTRVMRARSRKRQPISWFDPDYSVKLCRTEALKTLNGNREKRIVL